MLEVYGRPFSSCESECRTQRCYLSYESCKDVYLNCKTDTDSFVFLYFAGMYDVSGPYSFHLFPTFIDAWCPGVSNTLQSIQCFKCFRIKKI